jgi:hypothetical protein
VLRFQQQPKPVLLDVVGYGIRNGEILKSARLLLRLIAMMFYEKCSFCQKVVRGVARACVFCSLVAGPIAAGDLDHAQEAAEAAASMLQKKSTATSLTATTSFQWTWHTTSGDGGNDPFGSFDIFKPGTSRLQSVDLHGRVERVDDRATNHKDEILNV